MMVLFDQRHFNDIEIIDVFFRILVSTLITFFLIFGLWLIIDNKNNLLTIQSPKRFKIINISLTFLLGLYFLINGIIGFLFLNTSTIWGESGLEYILLVIWNIFIDTLFIVLGAIAIVSSIYILKSSYLGFKLSMISFIIISGFIIFIIIEISYHIVAFGGMNVLLFPIVILLFFLTLVFILISLIIYENRNNLKEYLKTGVSDFILPNPNQDKSIYKLKICYNCGFKLTPPFKVCPNCRVIQRKN